MKKIISSLFAVLLGVGMTVQVAHATNQFNTDPSDLPTVMVTNITQDGGCSSGPGAGCWHTSISANPGDVIGVQVYFHNSTQYVAEDTKVGMGPKVSNSATNHTFGGKVASTTIASAQGTASVHLSSSQSISFISGTARAYKNGSTAGYTITDEAALFGSGLAIGNVSPGWDTQGTITAQFKVSGNTNPVDEQCRINSFDADDDSISLGDSTVLRWTTNSDCDHVTLSTVSGDLSADGSRNVSPDYTTTYTLRAYDANGNLGDTRTVTVRVTDRYNDSCSISDFYPNPATIDRGNSSTLRWTTNGGVDYVTISGLSGNRSEDGSVSVSPYSTQSYTLRAYCDNGDTKTQTITVNVRATTTDTAPQAITTVASILSNSQARLNGLAVPNTTSSTTAWFEWGTSGSLGNRTSSQYVTGGTTSQYYSDTISGLVPGGVYYYRAVVQNQNGTAYGDIVRFQTTRTVTTTPPVIVRPTTVTNTVVAQSAPSLLELRVESVYDHMCVNGLMDYTITYRNTSTQTLDNTVLRFTHPKEITYLSGSRGDYEVVDRTLTIDLGDVRPGEQGTITIHARVNDTAIRGNLAVATATVVYTNTKTHAQEDAIAYALITVSNDCPNILGASVVGFGSFLPHTLLGWLLLILVILALIVLARNVYKKNNA